MGSRLYSALFWRVVLDVCSRGLFFFINILIARTLGVADFGRFAYAISLAQIFYIFTDLGTHLQLIKELGEVRGKRDNHWVGFLQLKMALAVLSFIVYCAILPFVWHWDQMWVPVLALFWMFSNSMLDFNQFVCNGIARMDLAKRMLFLHRTMTVIGTVTAVLFFRTLGGVMMGATLGGITGAFISNMYFHRAVGSPPLFFRNAAEWKRILGLSFPHGISGAFGSWYLRVGVVILGWVATSQTIGEYSTAFRFFEMTYIIPAAIMSIGVPHLSEAFANGRHVFFQELRRISAIMLPLGALWAMFLYFGSSTLVKVLYGAQFFGAVPVLKVFALVGGMVFANYVVTHLMAVLNFQRRHAVHQAITFTICGLSTIILVHAHLAVGAAAGVLIAEISLFTLTVAYLVRRIPS